MLIKDNLIKKAVENFPKWMDIRKRYNSSVGGNLLSSIAEEVEELQDEIDDYINSFFIPYYEDKVDKISDFVYKSNIGTQDISKIEMINPKLSIVSDISKFNNNIDVAYYQEGFIFTKKYYKTITIDIEGHTSSYEQTKMHVWNAFDEFAAFIGIRRFEDEDNSDLYNRIIDRSKRVVNSSENGLKNAICSSLINIVPELDFNDITIEKPSPENLVRYYDGFETILDKLIDINRDVLRVKQWGINRWCNEFKEIDYISSIWDVAIQESINGIGDNDDLKATMVDGLTHTDIKLTFYDKSVEYISKYIEDNDINDELILSLTKYNNVLESKEIDYKIIASEASDIDQVQDDIPIMAVMSKTISGKETRDISSIASDMKDIKITEEGKLSVGKYYRVKFIPKNKFDQMAIDKCEVVDEFGKVITNSSGEVLDYKKPNDKFTLIDNHLQNNLVKKSINNTSQLSKFNNLVDTSEGIGVLNIGSEGTLSINVDGCGGQRLFMNHECPMSNVLDQNIVMNNFYKDKDTDKYITENTSGEKSLEINMKANKFSLSVSEGRCSLVVIINNKIYYNGSPKSLNGEIKYETEDFYSPEDMRILITNIDNSKLVLDKLEYTNYILDISVDNGSMKNDDGNKNQFSLPIEIENNINIKMRTMTQYTPIITKIFIGTPLDSANAYVTDVITGIDNGKLSILSNCDVELYECSEPFATCDKYSDAINVTYGYSTDNVYTATSNSAYILLDTSEYEKINNVYCSQGAFESIGDSSNIRNVIKLKKGESLSKIVIDGYYNKVISMKTLEELIHTKSIDYSKRSYDEYGVWVNGDVLYSNKILKCFVVEKMNGIQSKVFLDSSSFNDNIGEFDKVEIINLSPNLECAFEVADDTIISKSYEGIFDNFYIYSKSTKTYVANNKTLMYQSSKDNIEIVNTFNNKYEEGKLMVYTIKNHTENTILFSNNKPWTIGKKSISIKLNGDRDYNTTHLTIVEKQKLKTIINLKNEYTTENKEVIELSQYMIDDNKDYKVIYNYDINDMKYLKAEFINVKKDGFNKLKYSNIVDIIYIGKGIYNGNNDSSIDKSNYTLDNKKGIISWNNESIVEECPRLCIAYIIKIPVAIEYNLDKLYNKIQYPIQAYKKVYNIKIDNVKANTNIDLENPQIFDYDTNKKIKEYYPNTDIVYCECSKAGFSASKNKNIITILKSNDENTLAVKSGWYYMFGKEYYMFSTDQNKKTVKDEYVTMHNVTRDRQGLTLHKKTSNMIKNSKMILGSLAETYKVTDFKNSTVNGASEINSITACDSLNGWSTFGMNIKLVHGLNGIALYFEPGDSKDTSYAVLKLDKYINDKNTISFYNPNKLQAYIGIGEKFGGIELTDTINIDSLISIDSFTENINFASFNKHKDYNYYLVIRGSGILDDIILENSDKPNIDLHIKNISHMNYNIEESSSNGVIKRLFIDNGIGHKSNNCEIDSNGYIENSSDIDWNITKIKKFNDRHDWEIGCSLENIDINNINDIDCALVTNIRSGVIKTRPIYIGNTETIKSMIYKINNIPLENMDGFKVKVYQSQTSIGPFVPCNLSLNEKSLKNIVTDIAYSYIQLIVEMEPNKVIDTIEIYIDYKSDENNAPSTKIYSNGEYISKVFDTLNTSKYKVIGSGIKDKIGEVDIFIRASRLGSNMSVWTEWENINVNPEYNEYRFFQIKVKLNGKESKVNLEYVDIEVKG